jgi:hypothetical protein
MVFYPPVVAVLLIPLRVRGEGGSTEQSGDHTALQQCRQLKTGGDEAVRMLVDSASHTATREGEARAALARAKERVAALQQARGIGAAAL